MRSSTLPELWRRRSLIWTLAVSNLKQAHRNTALGYLWWLLDPVLMTVVYTLLFAILRVGFPHYPAFVMCGLIFWKCFSTTTQESITVLARSDGLLKSFSFPTAVLPLSLVISNSVLFAFALLPLLALCAFYQWALDASEVRVSWTVVYVPAVFAVQVVLCLGSALLFSCFGAFLKDLHNVMSHALRVLWYLSPGMYAITHVPGFGDYTGLAGLDWSSPWSVYALSPFVHVMEAYRGAVLFGRVPDLAGLGLALALAAGLAALGLRVYQSQERKFVKVV